MHTHQEKIFAIFPENQKAKVKKKKKNAEIPSEACWLLYAVLSLIKSVMRRFSQPLTWQQLRGDSWRLWGCWHHRGSPGGEGRIVSSNTCIGFPRWLIGKESACQCRSCRLDPCIKKIPWRRKWQPTPTFSPGKSHGQRSLVGCSLWDRESVRHNLATKQRLPQPSVFQAG